jgi:hypothetical protein
VLACAIELKEAGLVLLGFHVTEATVSSTLHDAASVNHIALLYSFKQAQSVYTDLLHYLRNKYT